MRILATGARGFIGSALFPRLAAADHQMLQLSRSAPPTRDPSEGNVILWNPAVGLIPSLPEGIEAVVHLAGENIAAGRWTAAKKNRIRESRVAGVSILHRALARLSRPPRVEIIASAVGYYGNRGDEILTESSPPGQGFLANVCREVEGEAVRSAPAGVRQIFLRFGIVLSGHAGALPLMARPFRIGLGGKLGTGKQFTSWIHLEDALRTIERGLYSEELHGPVLVASPNPVRNAEFASALGAALRRPSGLPAPEWALKLALGEMADELLLASQRAEPEMLKKAGFEFRYQELEGALRSIFSDTK